MSLTESPEFTATSRPITSTALPSGAYVLSLAALQSSYAASSSAPSNTIYFYDKANLRPVAHVVGHGEAITTMRAVPHFAGTARETLVSSGKDGLVKVWDERTGAAAVQMQGLAAGRKRALLSCDVSANGMTVAAGTDLQGDDASLLYWDPRNPAAPLRVHSYTHSDDITAVHFLRPSPAHLPSVLLSISSDGLISTSNADEADEDEAGLHVGNWGCSVAQAGWVHGRAGSPGVWAASDMETFSAWSGELDMVYDIDIRQPSIHRQDFTWMTDYLVGCHNSASIPASRDNDLCVFAGSNEGDIALITRTTFSDASAPWTLERQWTNAHVGVVRSVLWDEQNNILITGGEDSRINVWSAPPLSSGEPQSPSGKRESGGDAMDVDEDSQRKRRRAD
ncbi:WD40 repeat-like protein [Phanerochaete sordida]|uniref:WD40 repeat-like protein n=1 Tax=Phanerochaete sordida TaxID=48140 RepID=A0A9P3L8F9_9APHY|nr:WD40 repeat-like protein [Phanerochaete sordida]